MKNIPSILILISITCLFAWAPDPEPGAFSLPDNQWTKIAENPVDLFGRELEPGTGAFLCFIPDSGHFIRYGGFTPTESNDLWTFNVASRQWQNPLPVSYDWPPPANRPGAGPFWNMAYDTLRKCVWLMGGSGVAGRSNPELYNDIWKFEPATGKFTKMNSIGFYHGNAPIVYDAKNDLVVRATAYNGEWSYIGNRDCTKIYDPKTNTWTSRSTPAPPNNGTCVSFVYCPNIEKSVYLYYNGSSMVTCTYDAAANVWDTLVSDSIPPARQFAAAAYDPTTGHVLVYGGIGAVPGGYSYLYRGGGYQLNDTWSLDPVTGQWTRLSVGLPRIPSLNAGSGSLLLPATLTTLGSFTIMCAAGFDARNNVFVVSAPRFGVWALRYRPAGSGTLPALSLPALPALPAVQAVDRVYPQAPLNTRLTSLTPNRWLKLNGGFMGGGEVPLKFDPTSGWLLKYGGCNNNGTTFASGYGNDLTAYDPASERWIPVRSVDPTAPPRPGNGCTRYYAADAGQQSVWFAGGTSGNYLPSRLPQGWTGSGTWRYLPLADKFDIVASTGHGAGNSGVGAGVGCGFDPVSNVMLTIPKAYSDNISEFNAATRTWSQPTLDIRAPYYNYGDFVDTLGLFMITANDTLYGYSTSTHAWRFVSKTPEAPNGRVSVAYDCYNQALLVTCLGTPGKTYMYDLRTTQWSDMNPDSGTPAMGEQVAFDRRHGVFVSMTGSGPYAYKYKNAVLPSAAEFNRPQRALPLSTSPNPSNSGFCFSTRIDGLSSLKITDINGRTVRTIDMGGTRTAGWNGCDGQGRRVGPGLYTASLMTAKGRTHVRIILSR